MIEEEQVLRYPLYVWKVTHTLMILEIWVNEVHNF
jgi:hypothetical protein